MAACFTVYLSDADENERERHLQLWREIITRGGAAKDQPLSPSFNFIRFITTESLVLQYKQQGLPGDSLSLENSFMIFNSA